MAVRVGIDPSPELLALARRALAASPRRVELREGSAERLPFGDRSFDAAVVTWSLCSIPDPGAALAEARRVLKPGGRLLFAEHGLAPDPAVRRWQERLIPAAGDLDRRPRRASWPGGCSMPEPGPWSPCRSRRSGRPRSCARWRVASGTGG